MAIDFDEALDPDGPEVTSGMNITPLIDVLLVLLVMIIITIPIQLHSMNMELPVGLAPPPAVDPLVVKINVDAASRVRWNGEPVADRTSLEQRLAQAARLPDQPEIHVQADRATPYDTVAAILATSQRLGLQKIGVVGLEDYAK
ncbi:ExbD/TolR family protein [Rhodoferax sp.]|uniref:ExbD/TolR family protein n=1 Tax=Rhodoferax sp. TaxID=50421 RepID=UPI00275B0BBD|nr:biopolymer transporter ExbD [Rhodoferax sp.]